MSNAQPYAAPPSIEMLQSETITRKLGTTIERNETPVGQTGDTITNEGVSSVDTRVPIISPGKPVIVGMGAIREKPWVVERQIAPRTVTNIGMAIDHRIIGGEESAMFFSDAADDLTGPRILSGL